MKRELEIRFNCVGDALQFNAKEYPHKTAFILKDGDEEVRISFLQLFDEVKSRVTKLKGKYKKGSRLLLLFPEVKDFIATFVAVKLAGYIPVPMFPPRNSRHGNRLKQVLNDCDPAAILTVDSQIEKIKKTIDIEHLEIYDVSKNPAQEFLSFLQEEKDDIAFIQYTSGSTGSPKGVMISNGNLVHNLEAMKNNYGIDEASVLCSWLPFYHDMGLVGKLLQGIYCGCTLVTFSPTDFVKKPLSWIKTISDFNVTHSAAPNFAYDYCVQRINDEELSGIELNSWKIAVNGSEMIREETLRGFTEKFQKAGFNKNAFTPSYGLAEATLFVTGGSEEKNPVVVDRSDFNLKYERNNARIVSSGNPVNGIDLRIVDPQTREILKDGVEGEVAIAGDSIMKGYWAKPNNLGFFNLKDNDRFLATGDLGFLFENELYITGRIKEMLIIRGKNYLPYDLEDYLANELNDLELNAVSASAIDVNSQEELLIVAEVSREKYNNENCKKLALELVKSLRNGFQIEPYDVVFVPKMFLPKTSSGKIQRFLISNQYESNDFDKSIKMSDLFDHDEVNQNNEDEAVKEKDVHAYLCSLLISKYKVIESDLDDLTSIGFASIGLDSIKMIEIIDQINEDLEISLSIDSVMQCNDLKEVVELIELNKLLILTRVNKEDRGLLI